METLPVGTRVRVAHPENYILAVQKKLTNRIGVVTGHTYPNAYPIVFFPKEGRRKEFRMAGNNHHTFTKVD